MEGRYKNIFLSISLPIIALVSFYLYKNKKKINFENKKNQEFETDNQENLNMKQKDQIEGQNINFSNSIENNLENSLSVKKTNKDDKDKKLEKNEESKVLKEKNTFNNNHLEKLEDLKFCEEMNEKNLKKTNDNEKKENKNSNQLNKKINSSKLNKNEQVNEKLIEKKILEKKNSLEKNETKVNQITKKELVEKNELKNEKKDIKYEKISQVENISDENIIKSENNVTENSSSEKTNMQNKMKNYSKDETKILKSEKLDNDNLNENDKKYVMSNDDKNEKSDLEKTNQVDKNIKLENEQKLNERSELKNDETLDSSDKKNASLNESSQEDKDLKQTSKLENNSNEIKSSYIFEIPQELCGMLVGKSRKFISTIMKSSNVNVKITHHPFILSLNLCIIYGTEAEINTALDIIRKRFPLSRFPFLSLNPLDPSLINFEAIPLSSQLYLPEGVNCDVILSSFIDAGHIFLQQPTHPTFSLLNKLDEYMDSTYKFNDTPGIDNLTLGIICSVPKDDHWFRGIITSIDGENCTVRFLDYGGFTTVPVNSLRQVKRDFMSIPFQASECFLANIKPNDGKWSDEANEYFKKLAEKKILHSYIVNYTEDRIPLVYLYCVDKDPPFLINSKLVTEGFGTWLDEE